MPEHNPADEVPADRERIEFNWKRGKHSSNWACPEYGLMAYPIYDAPDFAWVVWQDREPVAHGREPSIEAAKLAAEQAVLTEQIYGPANTNSERG